MRTGGRRERVAERVRQEVAAILRFDLADPRVGRATVTRVEMTGDLALARVYVSVLGEPARQQETLTALRRAGGRVRSLLGSRLRLRATPEVRFVFDPSVEFGIRLEEILEAERARSPEDESAAAGPGEPPAGETVEASPADSPAREETEAAPGEGEAAPGEAEGAPGETEAAPGEAEAAPGRAEAASGEAEAAPGEAETAAPAAGTGAGRAGEPGSEGPA